MLSLVVRQLTDEGSPAHIERFYKKLFHYIGDVRKSKFGISAYKLIVIFFYFETK